MCLGVLAGGTGAGHVACWKYAPALGAAALRQEPEDRWKIQPPSTVDGPVSDLAVSLRRNTVLLRHIYHEFPVNFDNCCCLSFSGGLVKVCWQ